MSKHKSTVTQEHPKGAILKAVREEKGLSLESVHEMTKIPMDVLRAIEEGYTVRILSPFYYKGFVKMYAKFLNVDADRVLDEPMTKEELPHKPLNPRVSAEMDLNAFFKNDQIKDGIRRLSFPIHKKQIFVAMGIALGLFLVFKMIAGLSHKKTSLEKNETVVAMVKKEEKVLIPSRESVQPRKVIPKIIPKPAVAPLVQKINKQVTLTVRAKKKAWLKVKSDSQVVFQSTMPMGAVETWLANETVELSGNNIDQLEFEVNGKMIGTLGRKDRNAKTVVVTKDGLTVTK